MDLKQNTAANIMLLMVDSTDHVTGKTGLTLTVTASKNGGAFGSLDAGASVSEVANGWYKIALTTTDTNTVGDLIVHASATGADPTDRLLSVVVATPTDNATSLTTLSSYVDTEVAAIKAKTDLIPASPATAANVTALLTTAMTESYAADGAAPTPAQALYMILQLLAEKSIAGTTMTVKKLDGATTAMTFTLDSATAPTAITRAT